MIGKTISHYQITEKLGEGGMGVVYEAEDTRLKRTVALKFLPAALTADPAAKERFIQEAQAASALQHHNICTIHDIDQAPDGQLFMVMDYYEGETLKNRINSRESVVGAIPRIALKIDECINIAIQIAEGLGKAHEKGIIHRDIKPANILITKDGVAKILDFGLAKLAGQALLTKTGTTVGTVAYMSPEQSRGENVDHRTDIWSLGVVLYEMISGQRPFKGDYEQAVVYSFINETQDPLTGLRTGVPMELERIVNKALAKDTNERYQHVDELLVDLKRLKNDSASSIPVEPVQNGKKESLKKRMRNIVIGSSIILVTAIILLLGKILFFEEMPFTEPKPIVVISFKNQTGDNSYDYLQEAIPNLLITSLEQSKYLRVITWERMNDLLKQLGRENVDIIDKELGFELCRLEGVEAIILGSFVKAGDIFATDVKVLDVQSKNLLKSASSKGEGVGSILQNQIDDLSRAISSSVGISEQAVGGTQMRISDITTPSMEAYNYFLRGREDYDKFYYDDARKFLEKAVQLDSTFAVAYLYLAWANNYLGNYDERDFNYHRAKTFSKNTTDKDRLYIEANYAESVEKDPGRRFQILKEMGVKYPAEKRVHKDLGLYYDTDKNYDKALTEYHKALELDPDYGPVYNLLAYLHGDLGDFENAYEYLQKYTSLLPGDANPFDSMAELYLRMGKINEALIKYKEAIAAKPGFGSEVKISYTYAFLQNYDEALRWLDRYIENAPSSGIKGEGYWVRGLLNYWSGDVDQCLHDLQKCVAFSNTVGYEFAIALAEWLKAWIFLDQHKFIECQNVYNNYFNNRKRNNPKYLPNYKSDRAFFLGMVHLKQGQIDSAKLKLKEITDLLPALTPTAKVRAKRRYGMLLADLLLAQDSLDKAIEAYKYIPPLDIPFRFDWNYMTINFPFEKDGLAQAYIRKGDIDNAIATYERMITLKQKSNNVFIINPKYHYRLAKLYEEWGQTDKAINEYKMFLDICKHADKNQPDLRDAKRRLANLSGKR